MGIDENDPVEGIVDRIGFASDRYLSDSARQHIVALVVLEGSSTIYRVREILMDGFEAVALTRSGDRVSLYADEDAVSSFTNHETGASASPAEFEFQ